MNICLIDLCEESVSTRGLCKYHYNKLYQSGELESVALPKGHGKEGHRLSNKDVEKRKATCSVCGPDADIRFHLSKNYWFCLRKKSSLKSYFFNGNQLIDTTEVVNARIKYTEKQEGLCAICKIKPATHLDHCHTTGIIRGLLCRNCNLAIGLLDDNTDKLKAAIDYLNQ